MIPASDAWLPFAGAPRDGIGFLAYGVHDHEFRTGDRIHWRAGDHWWGILVFDIWREPGEFVFAKDGALPWSEPLCWQPLTVPA